MLHDDDCPSVADGTPFTARLTSTPRPERHPAVITPARYSLDVALAAVTSAGPSEGDVLRAALTACAIPSYKANDGGTSCVLVPINRTANEGDAHTGVKLLISSGEDAERPAEAHDEPWSAHLYGPENDFIDSVFTAPDFLSLDEESALTAWAVLRWLEANAESYTHP
ncbi:hypothetical protein ABZ502_17585 [Streptomyces abikoensis]|uniref:hypothetical protein n=1 Tax=Streptomyces abikoensis TaxID=97398 RepID=UPI0033E6BC7F